MATDLPRQEAKRQRLLEVYPLQKWMQSPDHNGCDAVDDPKIQNRKLTSEGALRHDGSPRLRSSVLLLTLLRVGGTVGSIPWYLARILHCGSFSRPWKRSRHSQKSSWQDDSSENLLIWRAPKWIWYDKKLSRTLWSSLILTRKNVLNFWYRISAKCPCRTNVRLPYFWAFRELLASEEELFYDW